MPALIPLPGQPAGVPWPTDQWVRALPGFDPADRLDPLLDQVFHDGATERFGTTDAVLVVHGGRLVVERYGTGIDATTTLPSWSMAKSILHTLVGVLVADGRVDQSAARIRPR